MTNYEKLGAFYLGSPYDLAAGRRGEELLLYDSKDLVTHAACFGMTGSGKTGLCVVLLEEAAIDGIPAIIIDPKGDLGNLLLTFPDLSPGDFAPWAPDGAAHRAGMSPDEFAAAQAKLWREGLAGWGQDGDRIRRLRAAADFAIYTPGSEAGLPVSLLQSFDAPAPAIREDRELARERVQATVTALLGLLGLDADPVQSREHILLSLILDRAWQEGTNLDLGAIIQQIQSPPVERVGMFDLESFYPAKERFSLAMTVNNVLASPAFEAWMKGEPLDIDRMLYTADGRPRVSIFSIAHLSDAERMFFVATLLNQMVSWMRQQRGTTTLRALLYMDEIAGYLPPVANPASKPPMMTLLKQARAFGVGAVLATQNPMDLDYKALSNIGTWFVGRLQTDRDQARVLDGLEGAAAGAGGSLDRKVMERTLSGLGKRVFLMYNVHEERPEVFETRWALSYLPGPLTREQIKRLTAERKVEAPVASQTTAAANPAKRTRPVLPPDVPEVFFPMRSAGPAGAQLVYEPVLVGCARVNFADARLGCDHDRDLTAFTPLADAVAGVDWSAAARLDLTPDDLDRESQPDAGFEDVPAAALKPPSYTTWSRRFAQWVYQEERLTLWRSPSLKEVSQPGESERDFRIRLEVAAREERDRQVESLRKKYAPKLRRLEERIRRAEAAVEREKEQSQQSKLQSTISIGATVLGAFLGRKVASTTNVRSAGTAMRSLSRSRKEAGDVDRAKENLEAYRQELEDMEEEFRGESSQVEERIDPRSEELESVEVRPKKTNITVRLLSLAWLPYWKDPSGASEPAWK